MAVLLTACWLQASSQKATNEAAIKAVFLFNFSQFVEWPATAFSSPAAPMVIGILGDDPFGNYIDEVVQGEKFGTHPLIVQRYKDVHEIKTCHILFINTRDTDHKDLLQSLAGRSVLTVSDNRGFMRQGGMIRFSTDNNKLKLEINADAAKQENLTISSKLLRIATIYQPPN